MSKPHGKFRALSDLRLNQQSGAVAGQDMLDDCKTKTGAFLRAAGLDIDPVKTLGNARNMLGRNARP